jgi:dipeptidyl aminopeptidase/acylaminoacyl peptidase
MKHKNNGNLISLFTLLLVTVSNSLWAAEVDTVWTSDYINEIQFQHPITKDLIFVELSFDIGKLITMDSKNGKLIKEVPFKNDDNNKSYISPDGTKLLHTNSNHTYIYEYPSLQLIYQLDSCRFSKFINNDEVVGRNFYNSNLVKYNIKTKEKQIFNVQGSVENIATSPDGRFIAYSLSSTDDIKSWSKLILMDAKTMKEIYTIEEVNYNDHNFGNFNFSRDGKYFAFDGKVMDGQQDLKVFSTETFKVLRNYNPSNLNADYLHFNFLNNYLYSLKIDDNANNQSKSHIIDINTDKILLEINNSLYFTFNNELNHLYYYDVKNKKIICLNISNLITGVTPTQPTAIVIYQNKQLTINKENVRKVEISDISGRLIMSKVIENPFSNNTLLPLNLANGSYLINITTDKESLTHKLMIME